MQITPDNVVENDEEFQATISLQPGEDSVILVPMQSTIEISDDDGN